MILDGKIVVIDGEVDIMCMIDGNVDMTCMIDGSAIEIMPVSTVVVREEVLPGGGIVQHIIAENVFRLQDKTVTPTNEVQEILPDPTYSGLYKVTVEAGGDAHETYEGSYVVDALTSQDQILDTANKIMSDDLKINKIKYATTSNEYGYTVYIGTEDH